MPHKLKTISFILTLLLFFIRLFPGSALSGTCECEKDLNSAVSIYKNNIINDVYGRRLDFSGIPKRIVSLVPAVTEMIEAIDPEYGLKGVTYEDMNAGVSRNAEIVGGFLRPDPGRIKALNPEIIFAASVHKEVIAGFRNSGCRVIILNAHRAEDIYRNIKLIGRIFRNEKKALKIIDGIKAKIANIQEKLSAVPKDKRVRVIRLMDFDGTRAIIPGDDSFQAEAIKLAGGIPLNTGRMGESTDISSDEWQKFNPEYVYACGNDNDWKGLLNAHEWNKVHAASKKLYCSFPCNLTCRASVNYGTFVEGLAAVLYSGYFFNSSPLKKDGTSFSRKIDIDIPYVKASIKYGTVDDFEHKTLVLRLSHKMDVLSTLTGMENVDTVGNHYLSAPRWNDSRTISLDDHKKKICGATGDNFTSSAYLITGADLDTIAIIEKHYKDMKVYALVTAGISSNAQRQSVDEGLYYPHGTINMIILANVRLTQGAMGRAVITATEAKTAALQDIDARSAYTPSVQATGTGTDNIIVVSGEGREVDSTGGHTKIGELTARAVYDGVIEAIGRQNRIRQKRSVFERLEERNISIYDLALEAGKDLPSPEISNITVYMEKALLNKEISGYLETAFTLSDAYKRNLVSDMSLFNRMSLEIAGKISGKKISSLIKLNKEKYGDSPLSTALAAIVTGAANIDTGK